MKPYITSSLDELAQQFQDAAEGIRTGQHMKESGLMAVEAHSFPDLRRKVRRSTLKSVATILRQTELRPAMSQAARMLYECGKLHTEKDIATKNLAEALRIWLTNNDKGQ